MFPQISCLRRGIVALNGCMVTLVAFVLLFSTVHFQMSPQIAFLNGCLVALVAFIRLSLCIFKGVLKFLVSEEE